MVDGVIVKVGRYGLRGHIVRRVLDRGKGIDHLPQRKNDNAARMLSRSPSHADTALHDPVDLTVSLPLSVLLKIVLYITKGRLIRQCTDGSGPEGLALTENNLGIIMGTALVFSGKV